MKCSPLLEIRKAQEVNASKFPKRNDKSLPGVFPKSAINGTPSLSNTNTTQYGRHNMNLASREQRQPQRLWGQSTNEPINLDNVLPNSGWTGNSPGVHPNGSLDNSTFDTCMSDNTSEGPRSTGQTPSTTHHSSSNTSYSPPQDEDLDLTLRTASHHPTPNSNTAATPAFLSWSPAKENDYPPNTALNPQQDDSAFTIPHGWQLGSPQELPDGLTGLSPSGDSGWAQMLEGVLWDGSGMGMENAGPWTSQQGPTS